MAQESLKPIGNEKSYTPEFFEELFNKINISDNYSKKALKKSIIFAAQRYFSRYGDFQRESPPGKIKKQLKSANKNIKKAAISIGKVIQSGNYSHEIVDNLYDVVSEKYPSLSSLKSQIKKGGGYVSSPLRSLALLNAMYDCIDLTLKNNPSKKTTTKSIALNEWLMILSATLEPILDRKLQQSRSHKGEYISKREISDSELLLLIINPLDPYVTISQLETAIRDTSKERHDDPWEEFFPDI
jgi:hypothetical protein